MKQSSLLAAMQTENARTENGMVTNSSSLNACVDLFFTIGAMRGQSKQRLIATFTKALGEDTLTAMRILFWVRDARKGAGERQIFKDVIQYLAENHTAKLRKNLELIPFYGRWDDLLALFNTPLDKEAKALIKNALDNKDGLCAKWMPRKGAEAIALEKYLKLSPKAYRKLLVENTKVVEQLMCAKKWDEITYEHVPSLAMARYNPSFLKHDTDRFNTYKTSDNKVNASTLYPYDITKGLMFGGDKTLLTKQWNALPNYMQDNNERVIPIVDVSDSMTWHPIAPGLTCRDVALSLGLYISERNTGIFQDAFITFSQRPILQYLKGSIVDRFNQLLRSDIGGNTNIEAVFQLILDKAVQNKLPESEMPTAILIMSDMEFDSGTSRNQTAQKMIESKYADAGYTVPKIIYWNIQSRNGNNFPVQAGKNNTALISGFSPSILKSLLSGEDMSPVSIMNKTVHSDRYEPVTV